MANHVLLNSVEHQDLKVIREFGEKYGDNQWFSVTFPEEFRSVQAHYPIFFYKDPNNGQFQAVALFGFCHNDNLFLNEQNWEASYVPLTVRRQPFLIGQQSVMEDGVAVHQRVVHIDLDSPRVSQTNGEPLFQPFGGSTPYLDEVVEMLDLIHHGLEDSKAFIDALLEHELLESFTLDLTLDNGERHQMIGFYTINETVLASLSGAALASLHNRGYLQAIYLAIASQSNIRPMMERINARQKGNAA
ncbi:SapC family protein [Ferrimonas balearica]|uniref:SapC family protein n=1 Tax=Ferrimonas balearica TaxID=44012 RepID=UPI001C99B665|nr:SapC family protein [Ferrimonas balearica]MBY5922343.1 SapC family protein [Ferrimonas balearica]MBY5994317.1 SapC family protein [Ferrimonas balearica]